MSECFLADYHARRPGFELDLGTLGTPSPHTHAVHTVELRTGNVWDAVFEGAILRLHAVSDCQCSVDNVVDFELVEPGLLRAAVQVDFAGTYAVEAVVTHVAHRGVLSVGFPWLREHGCYCVEVESGWVWDVDEVVFAETVLVTDARPKPTESPESPSASCAQGARACDAVDPGLPRCDFKSVVEGQLVRATADDMCPRKDAWDTRFVPSFVPHDCRFKRFCQQEARECLRTHFRRVVLIGDSLAREFVLEIGSILRKIPTPQLWYEPMTRDLNLIFDKSRMFSDSHEMSVWVDNRTRKWEDFTICAETTNTFGAALESPELNPEEVERFIEAVKDDTCVEQTFRTSNEFIVLPNHPDADICLVMVGNHQVWEDDHQNFVQMIEDVAEKMHQSRCGRVILTLLHATDHTATFRFRHRARAWNKDILRVAAKYDFDVLDTYSSSNIAPQNCDAVHCGLWRNWDERPDSPKNTPIFVQHFLNMVCPD